jgi:hypothetical protein
MGVLSFFVARARPQPGIAAAEPGSLRAASITRSVGSDPR